MLASRGFYKYLVMCLITVNLKAVFRHLDAVSVRVLNTVCSKLFLGVVGLAFGDGGRAGRCTHLGPLPSWPST